VFANKQDLPNALSTSEVPRVFTEIQFFFSTPKSKVIFELTCCRLLLNWVCKTQRGRSGTLKELGNIIRIFVIVLMECSATRGDGLYEGLEWLSNNLAEDTWNKKNEAYKAQQQNQQVSG
jgi:hypothetical protein